MGCPGRADSELPRSPSSPRSPAPASMIMSPCAACKILRRKCSEKCVLAPYFPPTDPVKFTIAHRVFGASNIIKFLQELPESQRADAVSSMVYEASARIRDPVYGCAGAICQLQKQINELQAELAKAKAEMSSMKTQHAHLMALICTVEMDRPSPSSSTEQSDDSNISRAVNETNPSYILDHDNYLGSSWPGSLWA
ncbi:LOB domain-containing protein 1-like [Punica granatum]|uniref:LOB domain-containing protein n=2 Tax=Punica granatum TaxID=22663 RepID=A0A218W7K9_PUNGR|nr:LOB domain-containing protein 1-like [Punica granatum]OWM68867.1 hypothetical protein CDL15_Pgr025054 [Punica granatum]PKI52012.1 hypothetical protein CRG98_027664 [Punica granatum]